MVPGASRLRNPARLPKSLSMTVRPILIHPDPRLKKRAEAVSELTPELRTLADDMLQTMYEAPGIGLAAPQVGVLSRLIVMDCVKDKDLPPRPMVLFNPEVTWASDERSTYEEGCLSIPEQYAEVERPAEVRVRWMDQHGATQEEQFDGLWATCVQHEIDHLDGKLFIDYLKPLKRQMITRKMVKLKRERERERAGA
jgi:peptide deformylase